MIVFLPRTWEIWGPVTGNCSSTCAFVPLGLSSSPEQGCVFRTGLGVQCAQSCRAEKTGVLGAPSRGRGVEGSENQPLMSPTAASPCRLSPGTHRCSPAPGRLVGTVNAAQAPRRRFSEFTDHRWYPGLMPEGWGRPPVCGFWGAGMPHLGYQAHWALPPPLTLQPLKVGGGSVAGDGGILRSIASLLCATHCAGWFTRCAQPPSERVLRCPLQRHRNEGLERGPVTSPAARGCELGGEFPTDPKVHFLLISFTE